ncbi:MAG TPA: flagellar motor stator protein MotA [Bryobacteraceae bacterium]|jgi:chemotaxis protein MotA|nr:flagellar motor stator protein MotA [Bryobacteraceae bacterium]
MFAIIGIVLVFGAVVGGYLMEHGNLKVLMQPAELLIIGGAGLGTLLTANPLPVLKALLGGLAAVFGSSKFDKGFYQATLKQMFDVMQKARKKGLTELEADVEKPDQSELFKTWDHHLRDFVCDTLRMAMTGGPTPFELDQVMELDMEVHHHYAHQPANALNTVADSLPGLGIVAAVLGVVITMGAIGGPPEEIGHKVAAALVGTFLGILLCYGLLGPMAGKMGKAAEEEGHFYHVVRVALIAFLKGTSPAMSVEFGRRAVPGHVRPSFQELENACKGKAAA